MDTRIKLKAKRSRANQRPSGRTHAIAPRRERRRVTASTQKHMILARRWPELVNPLKSLG
jgi:hypothetical protein